MFTSHLECPKCSAHYEPEQPHQLCVCGSPLLVKYDMEKVAANMSKELVASRPPDLWRYRELLPVVREENIVTMGEGMTPLLHLQRLGQQVGMPNLYMKDEGIIPSGSFKARGATVGVSRAKELGVKTLAMPTNGNAGAALAAYCTRCGIESYAFAPEDTPPTNIQEMDIQGAKVWRANGYIDDCGKIVAGGKEQLQWFDTSTLKVRTPVCAAMMRAP